ncbi:MAG: GNAT family N-acetyltransferase [Candidatus Heimdallarchaeota archaeon]|nr:GNAT family N-acetyltransferase [Candidatus Heimdallarchaeota archaeon]
MIEISEINAEEFDELLSVYYLQRFGEELDSAEVIARLLKIFDQEDIDLFITKNKRGLVYISHTRGIISVFSNEIDEQDRINQELDLFQFTFNIVADNPRIQLVRPYSQELLHQAVNKYNFKEIKRKRMTFTLEKKLESNNLGSDIILTPYSREYDNDLAAIIARTHFIEGHEDLEFLNQYKDHQGARNLLTDITNSMYGEFRDGYSFVLLKDQKAIGVCFITFIGDFAYIPEIVIDQSERGRGLGRKILCYTMNNILKEGITERIDLDVTLSNDARFLYESMGFQLVQEYSIIIRNN